MRTAESSRLARTTWPFLLPLGLLPLAATATYLNALHLPFVWDDTPAIVLNPSIRGSWLDALSPPLNAPVGVQNIE